ncbi:MAG: acyl-CoA synthetase FdrA [Synergistetes bacterium]|nr:acyl-CoA synthetase FdrA [Synergistota bacterium]
MISKVWVEKNAYYDSVTLMQVSSKLREIKGVEEAMVAMGTQANVEQLQRIGFNVKEAPNDLIIAIRARDENIFKIARKAVDELLLKKEEKEGKEALKPASIEAADRILGGEANLILISLPGKYAHREARKALRMGKHVFLFSDNVPIEEEISLKKEALKRGLLMMGPDCGTAIINGIALAFANKVPRGGIGLVAASGTGLQEVTTIIAKLGEGITQAIGTGGRDLSSKVGGLMMIAGLRALQKDEETKVIVLISKPPAKEVAEKVLSEVRNSTKPTVVCFLGGDSEIVEKYGAIPATTLEETALKAVALLRGKSYAGQALSEEEERLAIKVRETIPEARKYVRGLYSGGTLCDETMLILSKAIKKPIYSNTPLKEEWALEDPWKSFENTVLDLGDDVFTQGRPHPMIDPRLRQERILEEASDPGVAIICFDVVLGYGAHPDMAGELAPYIRRAREISNNEMVFVASVCGTEEDPQVLSDQVKKLEDAGVIVLSSNARSARFIAKLMEGRC